MNNYAKSNARSKSFLIVDDLESMTKLLTTVLQRENFTTYKAFVDPLKALAYLRHQEFQPDFIVTDYRMPGLYGPQLIKEARKLPVPFHGQFLCMSALPCEVFGGKSLYEWVAHLGGSPDKNIMVKPFASNAAFIDRVEELCKSLSNANSATTSHTVNRTFGSYIHLRESYSNLSLGVFTTDATGK